MVPPLEPRESLAKVVMSDTAITGTAMKLKSLVNTVAIKSKAVFKVSFSNNDKSAPKTSAPIYSMAVMILLFGEIFEIAFTAASLTLCEFSVMMFPCDIAASL